jgi:hypothetical protein
MEMLFVKTNIIIFQAKDVHDFYLLDDFYSVACFFGWLHVFLVGCMFLVCCMFFGCTIPCSIACMISYSIN